MKRNGSLNHIYRLVWNDTVHAFVAVAEIGRRIGKSASLARTARRSSGMLLTSFALLPAIVLAGPTGGHVTSGSAQITQNGQTTTIDQSSANVSINWQSFNVGAQETVDFVQPNASSIAVNRIFSSNGTTILGHLNANGQVFLIDPNGVIFGQGAQVSVGGLVASTLDLSGSDDSGAMTFAQSGSSGGKVTNFGTITAASGGYVALLGQQVSNQGVISARLGTVALGGGSAATLTFAGNQLLHLSIDQSTLNSLAENRQLIEADGGQVIMTAGAKDSLLASVVNNTGVIEARTVDDKAGVITLLGGMQAGSVNVGGTLDASAANGGDGGSIETSAATVKVEPGTVVSTLAANGKTGSWLIDPTDYTIAATGGDITGSALSTELASTNVMIESTSGATGTAGNVNVNASVSWSANTTLALVAQNNVNVNAPITATGATAGLVLTPGTNGAFNLGGGASITLNGATPSLSIAGVSYTVINALGVAGDTSGKTLQGMLAGGNYALGSNIDATSTDTWNAGAGFKSLPQVGILEGLGHTITNLYQDSAAAEGLIAQAQGNLLVRDLGLVNETIQSNGGTDVGGFIGEGTNQGVNVPTFINDYSTGSVSGRYGVGGIAGGGSFSISNSFSDVNVTGQLAGGLVGSFIGSITNSYAAGSVTLNVFGGSAAGAQRVGGLVGQFGEANDPASIVDSYSSAAVILGAGSTPGGGLIGTNAGSAGATTITGSFWDDTASGQSTSAGGVGLSGVASLQQASYTGFDFTSPVWSMVAGYTHPLLTSFLKPLTITTSTSSTVYNGSGQSGALAYSDPTAEGSLNLHVVSDAINVGSYNPNTALTYVPTQFGWLVTVAGSGVLTITPAPISAVATAGTTKVYDGLTTASVALSSAGIFGTDSVTFTDTSANYNTKDVGTGKSIAIDGIVIGGAQANDYTLINTSATTTGSITPLAISVTATGTNKVYDASVNDAVTFASSGVIGSDTVGFADSSATFANANVGTGKAVTVSGIVATGSDASNYVLTNNIATVAANITPAMITVTATGTNKTYDGTQTDAVTLATTGVINGDVISATDSAANFVSKNVGSGIQVDVTGITLSGSNASNYAVGSTAATTASITPATLTVTATGATKVYDGGLNATVALADSGLIGSDTVTLSDTSAQFTSKNVGTGVQINVSGISIGGADAGDYVVSSNSLTTSANISQKPITIGIAGNNKTYDGTTAASVTLSDPGVVTGDAVNLAYSGASFATKDVGNGKVISLIDVTATGADANNYYFTSSFSTTANITPAPLMVTATGANKVYDGSTSATVVLADAGLVGTDTVTLTDTGAQFVTKNVGSGVQINVSGISISGANAGDYTVSPAATASANITPATLSVTAIGTNKVYDGGTSATVALADTGLLGTDIVILSDTGAQFVSKNVGTGIQINVAGITASGADAGNYIFNTTASSAANITPATVTVIATGVNKVYDGATTATVSLTDSGLLGTDTLTLGDSGAQFISKNVGSAVQINVAGITATGADAGNYVFKTQATTSANITPATLTVSAIGANKVYDGGTTATVALADSGLLGTDTVTLGDTGAQFINKNVGTGIQVNVAGITATGADAGNYVVNTTATTAANITPATLTVTAAGANKVYDGGTAATVALADAGLIGSDSVTLSDTGAQFSSKNVGTGIQINVAGITATGADAGNYIVNSTALTAANITPKTITVSASGTSKTYDGTVADTVTLTDVGIVIGDLVTLTDTGASFADKNVGSSKTVTVSGLALSGANAGDYVLGASSALTSADITPASLTYDATPTTAIQGQSLPKLTGTITGFVPGDTLANATSGTALWTTPATISTGVGQYAIDGSGVTASNYVLDQAPANASALTIKAAAPVPPPAPPPAPSPAPQPASANIGPQGAIAASTVAQACSGGSASNDGRQEEGGCHPGAAVNAPTSPGLHVIDGGLKLPPQLVSAR